MKQSVRVADVILTADLMKLLLRNSTEVSWCDAATDVKQSVRVADVIRLLI